jgi:hypothetical protein
MLHIMWLGLAKYLVHESIQNASQKRKQQIIAALEDTRQDGIYDADLCRAEYLVRHAGSLVGKELKRLVQLCTIPFRLLALRGQFDGALWRVWRTLGDLAVLATAPEIPLDEAEQHCVRSTASIDVRLIPTQTLLRAALLHYFDAVGASTPGLFAAKRKLHFATKLEAGLRLFGPSHGRDEERFESHNTIFRNASVFSNKLSPSKDIALKLERQELLAHVFDGGFFANGDGFRQAGSDLMALVEEEPVFRLALGLTQKPGPTLSALGLSCLLPSDSCRCNQAECH